MQLCWASNPEARPTAAQVHALINHLHFNHTHSNDVSKDDGYASSDFEERWQRLKPNTIPKVDEHVAIVHAPSTSMASHFTGSDQDFDNAHTYIQDSLSVEMDTAVSRSSSIMSDKDPLSIQIKSESLTNLHGSLEDVRNIYLTHNETPALECHQGNISLEEAKEKEQDRSDSSMDPWLKEIITGSTDDVSYYKDVSDVIKNLDNILNSEKTSSSESSHQASPSRDNLSLECKKEYPMQTSMVKSPGINNFQNILDMGYDNESESTGPCDEEEGDRDTVGTLSHSFERHSDTTSQQTLENLTPETPIKDLEIANKIHTEEIADESSEVIKQELNQVHRDSELPNDSIVRSSNSDVPNLKELCVASLPSVSETMKQVIVKQDCQTPYDNNINSNLRTGSRETKSIEVSEAFINHEIKNTEEENLVKVNTVVLNTTLPVDREIVSNINSLVSTNCSTDTEDANVAKKYFTNDTTNECEKYAAQESLEKCIYSSKPTSSLQTENLKDIVGSSVLPYEPINKVFADIENHQRVPISNEVRSINNEHGTSSNTASENNLKSPISSSDQLDISSKNLINGDSACLSDVVQLPQVEDNVIAMRAEHINSFHEIKADPSTLENDNRSKQHCEEDLSCIKYISDSCNDFQDEIASKDILIDTKNKQLSEVTTLNLENINESHPSVDISSQCDRKIERTDVLNSLANHVELNTEQPEAVQIHAYIEQDTKDLECTNRIADTSHSLKEAAMPEQVQNGTDSVESSPQTMESNIEDATFIIIEQSSDSTVYKDLTNCTSSKILKDNNVDNNYTHLIQSCLETSRNDAPSTLMHNDSTVYLDLPSIIKETQNFLHSEKLNTIQYVEFKDDIITSTPKNSETSAENTLETVEHEADVLSETKIPDYGPDVTVMKLEAKHVPENLSPFDSPSKSHHTDTYDENSSVVLGPFENCTLELFKSIKSNSELADLPKEELLAFSSNFSEINLETPSPLRDGNFLNEVPDIVPDELHFDEIATVSEAKPESQTANNTDETEDQSTTERRVSPLTPPNSPGNFLASTSQQKYVVDIDISTNPKNISAAYQDAIDLNEIELQMTTKLAIAENENNMNIEYSGPLTEEGLTLDNTVMSENDAVPEYYLAGNGSSIENVRNILAIDEERMKELRNELELKLPLAQVCLK